MDLETSCLIKRTPEGAITAEVPKELTGATGHEPENLLLVEGISAEEKPMLDTLLSTIEIGTQKEEVRDRLAAGGFAVRNVPAASLRTEAGWDGSAPGEGYGVPPLRG
jgi:hypothetical protein